MREKGIGQVLDTLTARWFTDAFVTAHPEVIEWRKRQVMDTPPDVFLNVFDIYAETERDPGCRGHGTADHHRRERRRLQSAARINRLIQAALPGSDLVILPELKHAIFIEATDQVAPHIRRFLMAQSGR